jgi:Domain of unknown function (DUF4389)
MSTGEAGSPATVPSMSPEASPVPTTPRLTGSSQVLAPPAPLEPPSAEAGVAQSPRNPSGYSIDVGVVVPDRIARWRPFVQGILAIPLILMVYPLSIVAGVSAFLGWFVALILGQLPESLGALIAGFYRYYWRALCYISFLSNKYPTIGLAMGYQDPGGDAAWFDVERPEKLSRLAVFFRFILVIPQLIVLLFLSIVLYFVSIIAFWVVVILGRWPGGLRDFVIGANRWILRVEAWFNLLADRYPPFSLA